MDIRMADAGGTNTDKNVMFSYLRHRYPLRLQRPAGLYHSDSFHIVLLFHKRRPVWPDNDPFLLEQTPASGIGAGGRRQRLVRRPLCLYDPRARKVIMKAAAFLAENEQNIHET